MEKTYQHERPRPAPYTISTDDHIRAQTLPIADNASLAFILVFPILRDVLAEPDLDANSFSVLKESGV